jgi:hypothetical protein
MKKINALAAIVTLTFGLQSLGAILIIPQLYYKTGNVKYPYGAESSNEYEKIDSATMNIDFKAGYLFPYGLFVGGNYIMSSSAASGKTIGGSSSEQKESLTATGASIGYIFGGFSAIFTYVLSADHKYTSGGTEYKFTGDGLAVDLGYGFEVNGNLKIGPVLTYKSFTFKEKQVGSAAATKLQDKYALTEIYPMVGFWVSF